jgi:hypothetical protein
MLAKKSLCSPAMKARLGTHREASLLFLAAVLSAPARADYATDVLADGPMAYWKLNEPLGSTTFVDSTPNLHDGTADLGLVSGLGGLLAADPTGTSIRITGAAADPRIIVPGWDKFTTGVSTGYSVEYWLKIESFPAAGGFQNLVGDGEGDWYFMNYLSSNTTRTHLSPTNSPASNDLAIANFALAANKTYHVVATWDQPAKLVNWWVNGALYQRTTITTSNPPGAAVLNNPVYIGRDNRGGTNASASILLDEIAFYDKPLSADRIMLHYASGSGPNVAAGLKHSFNFDESSAGNGAASDSAGSLTGSFVGSATRTAGLNGSVGALQMSNTAGGVNIGRVLNIRDGTGLTIVARVDSDWLAALLDYDSIFRKEDGGNRILFALQNDSFGPNADPPVAAGPALSFGLNVAGVGYGELDVPLDGLDGRPSVLDFTTGTHLLAATYDTATGVKSIWYDGLLVGTRDYADGSGFIFGNSPGSAEAGIGGWNSSQEPWTGSIDDFQLYDRALSGSEIAALVPEPGAAALLLFSGVFLGVRRKRTSNHLEL